MTTETLEIPTARRPRRLATLAELRAPLDWATLLFHAPKLKRAPRGDGRPVMLLPGYGTDETSMRDRVGEIHDQLDDTPVTLIGWSLGGVIARETARLFEPFVREVITLGTPIIGGPKYTVAAERFAAQGKLDLDEFEKEVHARNSIGIKQPVTSIYSRHDGVVGWRASVDIYNAHARNIEVNSSHFGIGANGKVWRLIADILGSKES